MTFWTRGRQPQQTAGAAISVILVTALILSMPLGFWVSRDCYSASLFPRFYIALAGAMIIGPMMAFLGPERSTAQRKKAVGLVGQVIAFGFFGFVAVWNWTTAVPRFAHGRILESTIPYAKVSGWKNCRFGVEFVDAGGAGTIRVCGPLWELPPGLENGTIHVREKVGTLGVYLIKIESVS